MPNRMLPVQTPVHSQMMRPPSEILPMQSEAADCTRQRRDSESSSRPNHPTAPSEFRNAIYEELMYRLA
jgi:hypothetical protein